MHTNALFYRLFQERPATLFELAGMAYPHDADYRLRAVEVKQTAFRLNGVMTSGDHPETVSTPRLLSARPTVLASPHRYRPQIAPHEIAATLPLQPRPPGDGHQLTALSRERP
jgi:hypothetical protein